VKPNVRSGVAWLAPCLGAPPGNRPVRADLRSACRVIERLTDRLALFGACGGAVEDGQAAG